MEPIKLTLAKVIEEGRKAYLEGRLSAQGPTPECAYRDRSGRPCIVGAALTDEEARTLDEEDDGDIRSLINLGRVQCEAHAALYELQLAHDRWADRRLYTKSERAEGHARLRNLLKIEEAEGQ